MNYPRNDIKQDRECLKTQADFVQNTDTSISNALAQETTESHIEPKQIDSSSLAIEKQENSEKVRKVSRFRVSVITEPDPSKLEIKPDDSSELLNSKSKPKLSLNLRDCLPTNSNITQSVDFQNNQPTNHGYTLEKEQITPPIDIFHSNDMPGKCLHKNYFEFYLFLIIL